MDSQTTHSLSPQSLSPPALEVLGALAPFGHSGPYRPPALRRYTSLTPTAFERALSELAHRGLVALGEQDLWMTPAGESATNVAFS